MASKWLSITFFYKSIPIYPGKSRTIPESQLGRTMFLLTSALVTALEIIESVFQSFGRKNAQIYTFAGNLSIFSYHLPAYCKTIVFLIGLHILFRNSITLPIIQLKLRFTKK